MSAANGTRNACADAEVTLADKETVIAITVVSVSLSFIKQELRSLRRGEE